MSLKRIQLFTFDVHNVLLTVRNGAVYHYIRLARQHLNRDSMDLIVLRRKFFQAFRRLNEIYPGYGVNNSISSRQWWTMVIDQTFEDHRLKLEELQLLSAKIYDELAQGELWLQHPQADRVLKELKKTKLLGVISNFDERLESLLEQHHLRSNFQFVLTPRNCGFYKPQKEIFLRAMQLGNIEKPENLCHVGDDVQLDYRAAKSVGCQSILLCKDEEAKEALIKEHPDIPADHVITSLDEVLTLALSF